MAGNRPTITDLAAAAGVSVATVDRVLNQRHTVREGTAERVLRAAEEIGYHATTLLKQRLRDDVPQRTFGFLLQEPDDFFYRQLAADLQIATRDCTAVRGKAIIDFVDELVPSAIAERIRTLGAKVDALAVVTIDHPYVSEAIDTLRAAGVPTFTMISDLTAETRAGYVGRDNRKEGRTAAWMIAKTATAPGKVGIIVGSRRHICQEVAEISFRSYFRQHAPDFVLLEAVLNLDEPRIAYEATIDMMETHPDLVGLYICGGGEEGVIAALREETRHDPIAFVCNELRPPTRSGLIDGIVTAVISTPTALVASKTVEAMVRAIGSMAVEPPSRIVVPFDFYIPENI